MEDKLNIFNSSLNSNINNFTNILHNYGITEETYSLILQEEINEINQGININNQRAYNINIEVSFHNIKNTYNALKQLIDNNSFSLFSEIEKIVNNCHKNEFKYLEYILNLNDYDINSYFIMLDTLNDLKDINSNYSARSNISYLNMKNYIISHFSDIQQINHLITICEENTYKIINDNLIKLKNNLNQNNENGSIVNNIITIPEYSHYDSDNSLILVNAEMSYSMNYEVSLSNINKQNGLSKIIGYISSKINPEVFSIDFSPLNGPLGKIGKKINLEINNTYFYTNFEFDIKSMNATVTTDFNIEKYSVKTIYYEEKINTFEKVVFGIKCLFPDINNKEYIEIDDNQNYYEIAGKNKTMVEKYYFGFN